jgi:hypothetical protein
VSVFLSFLERRMCGCWVVGPTELTFILCIMFCAVYKVSLCFLLLEHTLPYLALSLSFSRSVVTCHFALKDSPCEWSFLNVEVMCFCLYIESLTMCVLYMLPIAEDYFTLQFCSIGLLTRVGLHF